MENLFKMCTTFSLLLLFSMMGYVQLISVKIPQKHVNVTMGGSVLLQCTFITSAPTTGLTIQWTFVSKTSMDPQQLYYYQSGVEVIAKSYEDRLKPPPSPNTTKNASITLSNMQVSDAGVYTCDVHNIPDVEGNSEGDVDVTILERPSTPFCAIHGDVETGHLVTLTCHAERGSPTPTYTWTRLDQDKTTRKPPLGSANIQTGVMYIRNLSQFQFGEYQCNASNAVGFAICNLELTHELGDGAIAGAVIGALFGAVLIILLVWCVTHKIKKQKYSAAKTAEASEMKARPQGAGTAQYDAVPTRGSAHQASVASGGVPMATTSSQHRAEEEEVEA